MVFSSIPFSLGFVFHHFVTRQEMGLFHIAVGGSEGKGSEHTIDGIHSELEMHFVHYDCECGSLKKAVADGKNPQISGRRTLAVIAVMFKVCVQKQKFLFLTIYDFEEFESFFFCKIPKSVFCN